MKSTAKDAKRAGTGAEPGRRPVSGAARGYARQAALPRATAFWLVAAALFVLLFASGAASPLYGVYQAQWRFSAITAMTLAAIQTASAAAFLAGTAVAGAGFGTGFFLGAYRILTPLAGSGQRASLIAALWIVYYLAFSVPVVIAGVATTHFGVHRTAVAYSAALAVLAAAAAGSFSLHRPPGREQRSARSQCRKRADHE